VVTTVGTFSGMADTAAATRVPLVDYLVLDDGDPHLVANECTSCGARFFDRRNACAGCSGTEFKSADIPTQGELRSFTIVAFAAPGIDVPFVSGIVDCGGTTVRGNIVNVEASPEHVKLGMPVKLTTFPIGKDEEGVEAINFGFEPAA
jgi:uncharacterized OB-fold protein